MRYEELDIIFISEGCAEDAEIPAEVFEELEEDNDL